MAEERLEKVEQATEEPKYVFGYTVKVTEQGQISLEGVEFDGKTATEAEIVEHMIQVVDYIKKERDAEAEKARLYEIAYYATRRALTDMAAAKEQANSEPSVEA